MHGQQSIKYSAFLPALRATTSYDWLHVTWAFTLIMNTVTTNTMSRA